MNGSVRLGKVLGIPIAINYTWFIVFGLVTWSLAASYFPTLYAEWGVMGHISVGVLTSILFFVSVLIHELAHSVVAQAWGIPVKSITLFIFGGVANISREPERPLAEFVIAIAGPAASLALGAVFGAMWLGGELLSLSPVAAVGQYLGTINLWLALFNLIPGFPLDGGRVFRSIVWAWTGNVNRATRWAATTGRIVAMLLIVGGVMLFFAGGGSSGLWLAFIGWFLDNAAQQSGQQAQVREALQGYTAGDFSSGCQTVDQNLPLDWVVRDYVLPEGVSCFLVSDGVDPEGVATLGQIRTVPRQQWGWTPIRRIMTPMDSLKPVGAGEAADKVLERMMTEGQTLLPVVDGNRFLGLIFQDHLLRFAKTRAALRV